jgi:hypothetical protein
VRTDQAHGRLSHRGPVGGHPGGREIDPGALRHQTGSRSTDLADRQPDGGLEGCAEPFEVVLLFLDVGPGSPLTRSVGLPDGRAGDNAARTARSAQSQRHKPRSSPTCRPGYRRRAQARPDFWHPTGVGRGADGRACSPISPRLGTPPLPPTTSGAHLAGLSGPSYTGGNGRADLRVRGTPRGFKSRILRQPEQVERPAGPRRPAGRFASGFICDR